jgi:hypothetical protein
MTNKWTFQGRYAIDQENLANRAMMFLGCNAEQAVRLANAFASDYGNYAKTLKDAKAGRVSAGQSNKDGWFKITEKQVEEAIIKNPSPALSIFQSLHLVDKVFSLKNGIVPAQCSVTLIARLNDWLFQVPEVKEEELQPV